MEAEITKMSTRGQVVIPQDIRHEVRATEGTTFAVMGSGDTIILKRVGAPSKEELMRDLKKIAAAGKKRLESKGISESDIPSIVQGHRRH